MDQALYGMCLREKRLVEIPSELAYGEHGVDGIPGGADLMFNVELVDIWNPADGTVTEAGFQTLICQPIRKQVILKTNKRT